MAPFAVHADVTAVWRALTADEQTVATGRLAFASSIIRREFPTIDDRLADPDDPVDAELVKHVTVEMVLRAMRNPEGLRQVSVRKSIDDFATETTEVRDQALSAGAVYLTEGERGLLAPGRSRRAFSITPGYPETTYAHEAAVAEHRAGWGR